MLALGRRFLLTQALLLWQGGFLFYAAVVVPIGTEVLGSAAAQGVITRRVTDWLNVAGLVYLVLLAWDVYATRDPVRRRETARWWLWIGSAIILYLLWYFHELLDLFMDPGGHSVQMRRPFLIVHGLYLWASTVHWLFGLALAWLTLGAWRAEDEKRNADDANFTADMTQDQTKSLG
jgi:hypothetical protein